MAHGGHVVVVRHDVDAADVLAGFDGVHLQFGISENGDFHRPVIGHRNRVAVTRQDGRIVNVNQRQIASARKARLPRFGHVPGQGRRRPQIMEVVRVVQALNHFVHVGHGHVSTAAELQHRLTTGLAERGHHFAIQRNGVPYGSDAIDGVGV